MQSNRIVVVLAADGVSGLDISYGKNINTMYLNSHLNNEFVVRPNFLLGASETMWVTFTKGDVSTKPLMLVQRKTTVENSTRQVVDGTESTIEQTPDTGYEYYLTMPDVVLQNVGQWSFSLTISELPVDVTYKGTVATVAALPSGGLLGDTYWVSGTSQYEYWNGSAWAVLNIVAISTSDVGTITVNASVAGDIGGTATDLDIQVLYSFVVGVLNNLSDYLPKIVNGYWYVWNSGTKGFVNSGEAASSLLYLDTLSDVIPPQVGDGITTRPAKFNRVPIIGETFTVVLSSRGNMYICLMKYTDEGQNLSRYLYVGNTRGAQGEQGIQGEQGEKGDTGVGIASVTQKVVDGGTQITITLTNGTSTSFIVSNGDVSNVQSLEFPYGDPVVTYDTTDGLHVHADLRVVVNGVTNDIPLDLEIPQVADDGLTQDATADGKKAVIKTDETVVRTNKANQTINGNVTISGNVTVKGAVTSVSAENLKVKNKLIVVAEGNTVTLTSPAGLLAPKYDGTNSGALVFDGTGTAYVGDVVLTADGDIDVAKSDLQPLATRGTLVNGNIVKWNGDKLRLEDTGIAAGDVAKKSDLGKVDNFIYKINYESATVPTVGQVLTLTNANFSRTPVVGDVFALMEVVNVNDTYYNNMEVLTVGDTTCTAKIMSFTDITSCKLTKVTAATTNPQVYAKAPDGSQVMTEIKGGNGIIVDTAEDGKSLEARVSDTIKLENQRLAIETPDGVAYVKLSENKTDLDGSGNTWITINGNSDTQAIEQECGTSIFCDAVVGSGGEVTNWQYVNAYYAIGGVPPSSSSGTFLDNQSWNYLKAYPNKLRIKFNKEFYQLADDEHTTGTLVFSHVGYESGQLIVKTITIILATRGWVLSVIKPATHMAVANVSVYSDTDKTDIIGNLVINIPCAYSGDIDAYITEVGNISYVMCAGYVTVGGTNQAILYAEQFDPATGSIYLYTTQNENGAAYYIDSITPDFVNLPQ
jgi:hypothetical protein